LLTPKRLSKVQTVLEIINVNLKPLSSALKHIYFLLSRPHINPRLLRLRARITIPEFGAKGISDESF
jgi:hypothetical protein